MRLRLLLLAILALGLARASEPAPPTAPRRVAQESLALLKQAAPYVPPPAPAPDLPRESAPDVVLMEPVIVTEPLAVRQLRARIEDESRKLKDAEYSIVRGGTLYRSKDGRLELGTWAASGGITFLRIQW